MFKILIVCLVISSTACATTQEQTEQKCFKTFQDAVKFYLNEYGAIPQSMGGMLKGGVVLFGNSLGNWILVRTIPGEPSCELEKGPAWIIFQHSQGQET